jgi:signal peptidase I
MAVLAGCGGGSGTVTVTERIETSRAESSPDEGEEGSKDGAEIVRLTVPSGSMEPTLMTGETIKVNIDAFMESEPALGDIVVFHPPDGAESASECGVLVRRMQPLETGEACPTPTSGESSQTFVKRTVAVGGDTLSIKDGHPVVNGVEKTDEPYIDPCGGGYECNLPKTITIPKGSFFMMGDNRGESDDSRYWGPVPESWIVGKVEE